MALPPTYPPSEADTRSPVGVILAGGLSTRMGTNKALVKAGERRLIDVVAQELRIHVRRVVVSGKIDGYECVQDSVESQGPVSGILSILKYSNATHLLITAVDMPGVPAAIYTALLESNPTSVTHFSGKTLPLLIHVTPETKRITQEYYLSGRRSIHGLLESFRCRIILPQLQELELNNLNTLDDLQRYNTE